MKKAIFAVLFLAGLLIAGAVQHVAMMPKSAEHARKVLINAVFGISDGSAVRVVDTTVEAIAMNSGIYSPFRQYGPVAVDLENTTLPEKVVERIRKMKEGEAATIVVPPSEQYNASKVMAFPVAMFGKQPSVGETVQFRNMTGVVVATNSTAAVVDFNSAIAGKSMVYRIWLLKVVE